MRQVMIAECDLMMADMLADVLVEGGYEVCAASLALSGRVSKSESVTSPILPFLELRLAEAGLACQVIVRDPGQPSLDRGSIASRTRRTPQHAEQHPTRWWAGVERLLVQVEIGVAGSQFAEQTDQVRQRSSQPAHRPRGHDVEVSACHALQQCIQSRSVVAPLTPLSPADRWARPATPSSGLLQGL
jgi:hypothetical protein